MKKPIAFVLVWSLFFGATGMSAEPLEKRFAAVTGEPLYAQSDWGLLVVDSKTGEVVYERNPDRLFIPASVTKLYSCAAALVAFGSDHRFETVVRRRGEVDKNGKLAGDLILVASGDPSLGGRNLADGTLAFANVDHTYANLEGFDGELTETNPLAGLEALAEQIKAAGIKEIAGEVLIDDRLFDHTNGTGTGAEHVTPIAVNDNMVDLVIVPGKEGEPAKVSIRPETALYRLDALVDSSGKEAKIEIHERSGVIEVRGNVPADGKARLRNYGVEEPNLYARGLFLEALRRKGIRVAASLIEPDSKAKLPDDVAKLPAVATFKSAPMRELIKVTLKVSQNLYASTFPCLLAAKSGKKKLDDGLREQAKILADLGVAVKTISFGGGAGGAPGDRVTPRATVALLLAMQKRAEWKVYFAGLPVLGVDGTLAKSVSPESVARGQASGKTGTYFVEDLLNDRHLLTSKSLAGVLKTKSGRELTFAFFVNNVPLEKGITPAREGKMLGRLCEILVEE